MQKDRLSTKVINFWLAALNLEPLKVIRHSNLVKTLSDERLYLKLEQALEAEPDGSEGTYALG
jgi:hypothetical protein